MGAENAVRQPYGNQAALESLESAGPGHVSESQDGNHVRLWAFEVGSSAVLPGHMPGVQAAESDLVSGTKILTKVVGHSSPEGAEDSNMQLSMERAASVSQALNFPALQPEVACGERAGADTSVDMYPYYRAVDLFFSGQSVQEEAEPEQKKKAVKAPENQCVLPADYIQLWTRFQKAIRVASTLSFNKAGVHRTPTGPHFSNRYVPERDELYVALGANGFSSDESLNIIAWYKGEYGETPHIAMANAIKKANDEIRRLEGCSQELSGYTPPWKGYLSRKKTPQHGPKVHVDHMGRKLYE